MEVTSSVFDFVDFIPLLGGRLCALSVYRDLNYPRIKVTLSSVENDPAFSQTVAGGWICIAGGRMVGVATLYFGIAANLCLTVFFWRGSVEERN